MDERQILTTELFLPAAASLRLPAGTAAADVATVPAAVPTAVEPGPEPARAVDPLPPATEVYAEVLQAVDQLGETFGRADIGRVLPLSEPGELLPRARNPPAARPARPVRAGARPASRPLPQGRAAAGRQLSRAAAARRLQRHAAPSDPG